MNTSYDVSTLRTLAQRDQAYATILNDFNQFGALRIDQIEMLRERPLQAPLPLPASSSVSTSALERAIAHAVAQGVKQPTIRLTRFKFMPADPQRAQPMNRDAIFITSTDDRGTYLGKVLKGELRPSAAATRNDIDEMRAALEDPLSAAVRYGRETGECSICARTLSNPESVRLGIGPICRAKFGWA